MPIRFFVVLLLAERGMRSQMLEIGITDVAVTRMHGIMWLRWGERQNSIKQVLRELRGQAWKNYL